MAQAAQSMDVLSSTDNIKILANVLKTNVAASTSIGSFYLPQIGRIFLDMLGLYKAVSHIISDTVAKEGKLGYATAYRFVLTICRSHRNQDTKSQATADSQEGDPQAHGDIHPAS